MIHYIDLLLPSTYTISRNFFILQNSVAKIFVFSKRLQTRTALDTKIIISLLFNCFATFNKLMFDNFSLISSDAYASLVHRFNLLHKTRNLFPFYQGCVNRCLGDNNSIKNRRTSIEQL